MDIGTMRNYWLANLDKTSAIMSMSHQMNLTIGMQPHPISPEAFISPDTEIFNSVIGKDCIIESGCTIRNSVLLPGVTIKQGSTINNALIDHYSKTVMEHQH